MPRLSIVIAVSGDSQQLDDTLVSVLENRPSDCEILVVHDKPYHDPYNLCDEVRFVEATRGSGVVACLNRGLAASRSPVVHVLACGVEVCSGWADAALDHFRDPDIGAVSALVLDRNDRERIISAGLGYRIEGAVWKLGPKNSPSEITSYQQDLCGPDTLAAFYRKSAIDELGGFSASVGDTLAGIDLALALQHAGFRCRLEPQCIAHVGALMRRESAFRRGRNVERLFWRWASSHGWLSSVIGHVALLAGQCVISLWRPSIIAELAGRCRGLLEAAFNRRCPRSTEVISVETPSPVAAPHFALARVREEQQSSRVA